MQVYKLLIAETKHGYLATQPDFDFAIDADTIENAICAARNQIEQLGVLKMKNGEPIPEPKIDMDFASPNANVVFVNVDIEKKFKDSAAESVRKNISMPSWMDIQLRYYGVDASKMFQEAAQAFLDSKEKKQVEYRAISTVDELIANVDKEVLNEYVMKKLLK